MSTDVGDAIELTFTTTPGATVTATWLDPNLNAVLDSVAVTETPAASGKFPYTFLPTLPGMWTARFTASGAAVAVENFYARANAVDGPPPLATVAELGELFGSMSSAQEGLAGSLLRRASTMLRSAYPDMATRIAAGKLNPDMAAHAAINMALRVMRNPQGLRSQTVGPFTRTFDTSSASGLLAITDAEAKLLTPRPHAAAGTIRVRPGLAPPPCGDLYGGPGWRGPGGRSVRGW